MQDGAGDAGDTDPVNRLSAKVRDNFQLPKGDARLPDYLGESLRWFDENL